MRLTGTLLCWPAFCLLVIWLAVPKTVQLEPETGDGVSDACHSTVALPDEIRTALLQTPTIAEYLFVTRRADPLISGYSANGMMAASGPLQDVYPQLDSARIHNAGMPGLSSVETLFAHEPDVIFEWAFRGAYFQSLGLPVLCIAPKRDEEPSVVLNTQLYAYGLNQPQRAGVLIARYHAAFAQLNARLRPLVAQQKEPRSILFAAVSEAGRIRALASITRSRLVRMAGGLDVRETLPANVALNAEELLRLDPDIIVLQPTGIDGSGVKPQAFMQMPVWQSLRAVQRRQVYFSPRGAAVWFYGIVETPLLACWLSEILQPALPAECRSQLRAVWLRELGYRLSEGQLDRLLATELNRGSAGYQRFTRDFAQRESTP